MAQVVQIGHLAKDKVHHQFGHQALADPELVAVYQFFRHYDSFHVNLLDRFPKLFGVLLASLPHLERTVGEPVVDSG
jgi:hypothetical protein